MKGFIENIGKLNIKTLLIALTICLVFAIVESLLAGDIDVYAFFENLKQPTWSLPVWSWLLIGGFYYVLCTAILYNVLLAQPSTKRSIALALTIAMMVANTIWNYFFFGEQSSGYSFTAFIIFLPIVFGLFVSLWKFQRKSAWILIPYLAWLVYDFFWIWSIWKINK